MTVSPCGSFAVFHGKFVILSLCRKKDPILLKKEKISYCYTIVNSICSSSLRSEPDFPKVLNFSLETFLACCDDSDADVRMVADECLNRSIKVILVFFLLFL